MTTNELKALLLDEYGFDDKRVKRLEKMDRFIVDDRSWRDFGADRRLYPWFCSISVAVESGERARVTLARNAPTGDSVLKWARQYALATNEDQYVQSPLILHVTPADFEVMLEGLAAAVAAIVAPGAPTYHEASYKYVCPRVAASLRKLKEVLAGGWRAAAPAPQE